MNWCRSNELTCKTLWRGIGTLSAPAGWLLWLWGKSGPSVRVGCGLHLSSSVWQEQLVSLASFFLVSEMAFFPQMMKGCHCCKARARALSFQGADMTIRKPSGKYSHNRPVPSCRSQSCWRKYPLDLLSEKLSEVSEPPPSCKHLGKDHGLFFLLLLLFFHLFLLVGG